MKKIIIVPVIRSELNKLDGRATIQVPRDLKTRVTDQLKLHPTEPWDQAVAEARDRAIFLGVRRTMPLRI